MKRLLLLCALTQLIACAALKGPSWKERAEFIPSGNMQWRFQDNNLEIWVDASKRQELSWRFKNYQFSELTIDTTDLALRLDDSEERYTLWGEVFNERTPAPVFNIERQDYVAASYPVQPISPLAVFPIHKGITIRFTAKWDTKSIEYVIRFPMPGANPEGDPP